MNAPDPVLRRSPLDAEHRALGAKLVEFGGWEMPIQYAGVLDEHRACRTAAVVFDVSHLGSLRVEGRDAHALLQRALTNDLGRIAAGSCAVHAPARSRRRPRGRRHHRVVGRARRVPRDAERIEHRSDHRRARRGRGRRRPRRRRDHRHHRDPCGGGGPGSVGARRCSRPWIRQLAAVERFGVASVRWEDVACVVAGTGYTGEDGVEIHVPAADAPRLWRAVVAAGVIPAGLGARDTLRLEAGLPLHGHELGEGITPLQAGPRLGGALGQGRLPRP